MCINCQKQRGYAGSACLHVGNPGIIRHSISQSLDLILHYHAVPLVFGLVHICSPCFQCFSLFHDSTPGLHFPGLDANILAHGKGISWRSFHAKAAKGPRSSRSVEKSKLGADIEGPQIKVSMQNLSTKHVSLFNQYSRPTINMTSISQIESLGYSMLHEKNTQDMGSALPIPVHPFAIFMPVLWCKVPWY